MANNGKEAEKAFYQLMIQRGHSVQDVSADPNYYYKGDFILTDKEGQTAIVEVKQDERMWETGNLYLETINTRSTGIGGLGWWEYCSADYVAYFDWIKQIVYIFDMQKLHERVKQLPERKGYCGNNSVGLLVNINKVKDIAQVIYVY